MYDTTKIAWSMIVFLAALLLVYVLFLDRDVSWTTDTDLSLIQSSTVAFPSQEVNTAFYDNKLFYEQESKWELGLVDEINVSEDVVDGMKFFSTKQLFDSSVDISSFEWGDFLWKVILDDTFEREWDMYLLEILKLEDNSKYILKDNNNTHYVYLWMYDENVELIVKNLWWSYVDMSDQFTISKSQYFWVRVQKIEIPSYKNNLKELSIVTLNTWESWLIQMDANTWNTQLMRLEIKSRFEKHYSL